MRLRGGGTRAQLGDHVAGHITTIVRVRVARHVCHAATRVHEDHRRTRARTYLGAARIESERRDIVDDLGPRIQHGPGDLALHRVHRERHGRQAPAQVPDHRKHPTQFLRLINGRGALRSGALATDVQQISPILHQPLPLRHRRIHRKKLTPVAEAVGGNVDDPHDAGTIEREGARAEGPGHQAVAGGWRLAARSWWRPGAGAATSYQLPSQAGATSGPPRSGGFAGLSCGTVTGAVAEGGAPVGSLRGGSFSPRTRISMSSAVSVSRSSSAPAIAFSRSMLSTSV